MSSKNLDRYALSSVIHSGDMSMFMEFGVRPDFFRGEYSQAAMFVIEHFSRYSETPPPPLIKANFPWLRLSRTPGSAAYYTDKLRERELFTRMSSAMLVTSEELENGNPKQAFLGMMDCLRQVNLDVVSVRDMTASSAAGEQWADYQRRKEGIYDGISTGFGLLDDKIMCYENTDLIVIAAPPRSGKTWYATQKATNMVDAGGRVLFFSKEMKRQTIMRRVTATVAGIPYSNFRRGKLDDVDEARLKRAVSYIEKCWGDRLIIIGDDGMDSFLVDDYDYTNTLEFVESKILQHKPDAVVIDGFYLMSAGEAGKKKASWEQTQMLTRKAKRMCNKLQTPIILTTQLNRDAENSKSPNLSNLSFAYAIGMDADIVQFMMRGSKLCLANEAIITFPKIREAEDAGAMILSFKPGEDIDFIEPVADIEMDMMNALDEDS